MPEYTVWSDISVKDGYALGAAIWRSECSEAQGIRTFILHPGPDLSNETAPFYEVVIVLKMLHKLPSYSVVEYYWDQTEKVFTDYMLGKSFVSGKRINNKRDRVVHKIVNLCKEKNIVLKMYYTNDAPEYRACHNACIKFRQRMQFLKRMELWGPNLRTEKVLPLLLDYPGHPRHDPWCADSLLRDASERPGRRGYRRIQRRGL